MTEAAGDGPLGTRMAKGAAWMVGLRLTIRGIGFLNILILARLLVPDDFGIVALATTVVAAFEMLGEFGFNVYLVQRQDATREDYDTVWTLTVLRNLVIAACVVALSPLITELLDEPRLASVLPCLALITVVSGFVNVGIVDFQKELNFSREFVLMASAKIASVVVVICAALILRNHWAMILGIAVNKSVTVVLSYVLHAFRPRFRIANWRRIFNFSKWLLFNSIGGFFYTKADVFLVGRLVGMQALGLYTLAFELSNMATSELGAPIRRAILPGYAKIARDKAQLRETFLGVFSLMALAMIPVAVAILASADLMVKVLFGEKWMDCVPLVKVLALTGLIRAFNPSTTPLLIAVGKPQLTTFALFVTLSCYLPASAAATYHFGAIGAAWAIGGAALMRTSIQLGFLVRQIDVAYREIGLRCWRTAVGAALMYLVMTQILAIEPASQGGAWDLLRLSATLIGGAVVLVVTVFGLWLAIGRPPGAEGSVAAALERFRTSRERGGPARGKGRQS